GLLGVAGRFLCRAAGVRGRLLRLTRVRHRRRRGLAGLYQQRGHGRPVRRGVPVALVRLVLADLQELVQDRGGAVQPPLRRVFGLGATGRVGHHLVDLHPLVDRRRRVLALLQEGPHRLIAAVVEGLLPALYDDRVAGVPRRVHHLVDRDPV